MVRLLWRVALLAGVLHGQAMGKDDGWIKLFDGRSLGGWIPEGRAKWRVSGGSLVSDAGADGWRSSKQFSDFTLKIEYENAPTGNSGVFLRSTRESDKADTFNPAGAAMNFSAASKNLRKENQ